MKRSRKIVVLCHCLLNVNAKVLGLARSPGCSQNLVKGIVDGGAGIIQLPCPEMTYLGPRRWGMTREQYDTSGYRHHCRELVLPFVSQILDYRRNGYTIERVIGIDGSPSCGVKRTCEGYAGGEWGMAGDQQQNLREVEGKGIFMEVLCGLLQEHGVAIPVDAVDENDMDGVS
ncbi:MAG: DUF523 domain-containing protein [Candidatus Riflebacteria bacterium]|nr:DUF523 domain-containing protein [Candidatus Riflebacteria bacterium]